ncbi:hypothetical protein D0863_03375 [Hortaea werneckii]|uniref:MAPEG family protein n=1 Tax=Hortaea werneckii TaxID=91943 RepID=A0A3M7EDM6_HORWE|nr:hypothetical protein D0863_03375 [Hortaea werneckii]
MCLDSSPSALEAVFPSHPKSFANTFNPGQNIINATMSTASISLPVLTIPLYYILAIYPHGHASVIASKGNPKQLDNRNPKSSTMADSLRKRLSARELAAYERAESCHRNHLENMPLFVAAVLVGLLAEQRAGEGAIGLSAFCTGWMVIRILYTANYIVTETQQWSYLRSLLYFAGTGWAFLTFYRAATVLGN